MSIKPNLKKIVINVLLVFMLSSVLINDVKADKNNETKETRNLYEYCNPDTGCIVLCAYNTHEKDDAYPKKYNNNDKAYIGYYPENEEKKWELGGTHMWYNFAWSTDLESKLYTFSDVSLPKSDIYWESSDEDWSHSVEYQLLNQKLICPTYFSLRSQLFDRTKFCFSNEIDESAPLCGGLENNLKYSFIDEMKKVIDTTNQELIFTSAATDEEKNNFIKNVDTNYSNNYGKLNKEGCQYFNENNISNIFINGRENYIKNILNPKLKENVLKIGTTNPSWNTDRNIRAYNYETLAEILTNGMDENGNIIKRNIYDSNNKYYYDKLSEIYSNNVRVSLQYIERKCKAQFGTDFNIDTDIDSVIKNIETKFEHELTGNIYIELDPNKNYECSDIFTEEIVEIIKGAYFLIEMVAIVIVIIFSILDYAKIILIGGADELKKTNQNLLKRIIIVAIIFLLPALVNLMLRLFNIEGFNSDNPLCVQINNK